MLQIYRDIELNIHNVLKANEIVTRPGAGPGLWLVALTPAAVIATTLKETSSLVWIIFAVGMLLHSSHMLYQIVKRQTAQSSKLIHFGTVLSLVLIYTTLTDIELRKAAFGSNISGVMIQHGVGLLLRALPSAFTYGEATIIAHSFCLLLFSFVSDTAEPENDYFIATKILRVGVLGMFLLSYLLYKVPRLQTRVLAYLTGLAVICGVLLPYMYHLIQVNPLLWVLQFVFRPQRLGLIVLWTACSTAAGFAIQHQVASGQTASTVVRKTFHILGTVVFVTGILYDLVLLYLASGVVLGIFMALEIFRVLHLPPLADFLQNGFTIYADEKDIGGVALTPMYLLIGLSLPLWLHPYAVYDASATDLLPLLSGVLTVGIGDTCASYVGKKFGKHHWTGSLKTWEGTAGCIFGQISALLVLFGLGYIPYSNILFLRALTVITVASIVEAKTDQVDNILLPLVMYIMLML